VRAERGQVRARPRAELEEHGLAAGQLHDVLHVVADALDETGGGLGELVGVLGLGRAVGRLVPVPVAHGPLHAVLMIQSDVEPDRRIERDVLVQAEPGELAVEPLAVLGPGEVAVGHAPIGDGAGDAMNEPAHAGLALRRAQLAVKVLAYHHVGGQLAPGGRDLGVPLLEHHLPVLALDRRRAQVPVHGVEGAVDVEGAEDGVDFQAVCHGRGGLAPPGVGRLGRGGGRVRVEEFPIHSTLLL